MPPQPLAPSSPPRQAFSALSALQALRSAPALLSLALLVMYGRTLFDLLNGGLWARDEYSHCPLMLAVALWLMWRRWAEGAHALPKPPAPPLAWTLLLLGAFIFMAGRALQVAHAEAGSAIFMIAGCITLVGGVPLLRAMKFPLFFMVFMVPLPGFIVDPISGIMKSGVSVVTEAVLAALDYPVARTGVILQLGQYQLLVADACAGMRTLLMLEALGILYLNVVQHSSFMRNVGLALLIVPISFTANVIRVLALSLITYHWGDAAGQGFLHDFAGMVLFLSGLLLTLGADSALRWLSAHRAGRSGAGALA
jgi:exosortase B